MGAKEYRMLQRFLQVLVMPLLLASCSGLQESSPPPFVPDQAWADSAAKGIVGRMRSHWGKDLRKVPRIEILTPENRSPVLDSFPMAVRKDTAVRMVWQAIGLSRKGASDASQAGTLRHIATRAFFLPRSDRILLVLSGGRADLEEALSHELIHALQSQEHPLSRHLGEIREEDEMVGYLGALEGQAVFLAPRFCASGISEPAACTMPQAPLWVLAQAIGQQPQLRELPPALTLPAYAPYVFGKYLACSVTRSLGPGGTDTLLSRPPRGSWQLWNIESYLHDEQPVEWDTAWSGLGLSVRWAPLGQARIGEIRMAALLLEWDRDAALEYLRTRQDLGWRGDRAWAFRHRDGRLAYAWTITFRSENAARAFGSAWLAAQGRRLGTTLPRPHGTWARQDMAWTEAAGSTLRYRQEGTDLLLLQGLGRTESGLVLERLRRTRRKAS
jgi:hypothetical protein